MKWTQLLKATLIFQILSPILATHSNINKSSSGLVKRHEVLLENIYEVDWTVDFSTEEIQFNINVETTGYIGFGISYTGSMKDADIVIGGVFSNGSHYFSDRHGVGNVPPVVDTSQDWKLIEATEKDGRTNIICRRKLNTCDEQDIAITDDTFKIIWSYGATDEVGYHKTQRGVSSVYFKDNASPSPDLSKYKVWRTAQPFEMPAEDTTYWCTFFKGPQLEKKHHIVGFDIYSNGSAGKRHTHHADLYRCVTPEGENSDEFFGKYLGYGYDCYFAKEYVPVEHCDTFEFLWAVGARVTMFPDNLGIPIGDESQTVYYMTEMHYDNPNKLKGVQLHAGMEMYYTDKLREIDSGFFEFGAKTSKYYSLTVPPNSKDFIVSSHCPSECTSNLPKEGVHAFSYLLHTHLSGRKIKVRHYRKGVELPWMANDDYYDFNYQSNRPFKKHYQILPGDQITLECTYETMWKHGLATLGGRSSRDEMCQALIMYYPRDVKVNQCGSYYPQKKMLEYMEINEVKSTKGVIDPTIISPSHLKDSKYSHHVEKINWTEKKREEFQKLTRFGVHHVYCLPFTTNLTFAEAQYPKVEKEFNLPSQKCHVNKSR